MAALFRLYSRHRMKILSFILPLLFLSEAVSADDELEDDSSELWTPQTTRFWKHIAETQSGLTDWEHTVDHYDDLRSCLEENIPENVARSLSENPPTPSISRTLEESNQNRTILIQVENAISPDQAEAVKALAFCAREHISNAFEHRPFQDGGGNDVTFLGMMKIFLPSVAEHVYRIAKLAYAQGDWVHHGEKHTQASFDDYPPPAQCGLRTSEYLSYKGHNNLSEHDDAGSLYTILFALSDPEEYEGGEYYIRDGKDQDLVHYMKPEKYSAIVFLSESYHGVTDIVSGHRQMFTNELWKYEDPPWPYFRPRLETMELFLENYEKDGEVDMSDLRYLFPSDEEVDKWLKENGREGMSDGEYRPELVKDNEEESGDDEEENAVLESIYEHIGSQRAEIDHIGEIVRAQAELNLEMSSNVKHVKNSQDATHKLVHETKDEMTELMAEMGKLTTQLNSILEAINELKEGTSGRNPEEDAEL